MSRPNKVEAYSGPYSHITRIADGAITEASVVTSGTNPQDVAEAAGGDNPIGVAPADTVGTDQHEDGDQVNVITSGVVRLEASGAITEGAKVKADASGQVQEILGDNTENPSLFVGRALEAASGAGDVIEVQLE